MLFLYMYEQIIKILFWGLVVHINIQQMKKSFKIQVDLNKLDVNRFDSFIKELEKAQLGQFRNGEIIYDDKDENNVFALMDKHLLHNKK